MTDFNENNVIKFCGNCGKKLIENASFCAYCGFSIDMGIQKQGQTQKIANLTEPSKVHDYPVTHQGPGVPYTPYVKEKIVPRPFFTNFRGAILTPKTDLPLIAAKPNLFQPLILNLIIGILSSVAMVVLFSKMSITISPAFYDSLPSDIYPVEFDVNLLNRIMTISVMIFSPLVALAQWLIYSFILWILFSIFGSDIESYNRNFRKMATITGWAQIPMILHQVMAILTTTLFMNDGTIEYQSLTETIITGGEFPLSISLVQQGIQILLLVWSVVIIYYGIKSLGSLRTNPTTISVIYGVIVFVFSILLAFTAI